MAIDKKMEARRLVVTLGERGALAGYVIEGREVYLNDAGEEETSRPFSRALSQQEVAEFFGDAQRANAANVEDLHKRLQEMQAAHAAELDAARAEAARAGEEEKALLQGQLATAGEAFERLKSDAGAAIKTLEARARAAEEKLAAIRNLDAQYDAAAKPLLSQGYDAETA